MRDEHIAKLLDTAPLDKLSEVELSLIREHTAQCAACRQSFHAAQISLRLLRERTSATIEPSPFFKTRVMAAIRAKETKLEPSLFSRVWKAAGLVLCSMAAIVVMLVALTVFQKSDQTAINSVERVGNSNRDLTDWIVFGADTPATDETTDGQILTDIYFEEGDSDGNRQ